MYDYIVKSYFKANLNDPEGEVSKIRLLDMGGDNKVKRFR